MRSRRFKRGLFILSSLIILFSVCVLLIAHERRQTAAHQAVLAEAWVRNRFTRIQPVQGKVLLIPAPVDKTLSGPIELYVLADQEGYWNKPKLINAGFEFGFFDGARYYHYKIMEFQPDGVMVCDYTMRPPHAQQAAHEHLKVRWK
jgi:hypothetical protein